MEDCANVELLLSRALDEELTEQEHRSLEAHLNACPHCRQLQEQLAQLRLAFAALPEAECPPQLAQRVMGRIGKEKRVLPFPSRRLVRTLGSLAACAVLCVGLWQGVFRSRETTGSGSTTLAAPAALPPQTPMAAAQENGVGPRAAGGAQPGEMPTEEEKSMSTSMAEEPQFCAPEAAVTEPAALDSGSPEETDWTALQALAEELLGERADNLVLLERIPPELEQSPWRESGDGLWLLSVEQLSPELLERALEIHGPGSGSGVLFVREG